MNTFLAGMLTGFCFTMVILLLYKVRHPVSHFSYSVCKFIMVNTAGYNLGDFINSDFGIINNKKYQRLLSLDKKFSGKPYHKRVATVYLNACLRQLQEEDIEP